MAPRAAHNYFLQGEALYRDGKWAEALADFRAGYALDPRPEFLINIAQTERRLGQRDEALASCERFLARATDSALVRQVKQMMKELRAERAIAHAEAVAAEGAAAFDAGDYARALDAYQRAYLDNIDEARYLLRLADCYRALGRPADALRFYRLFLHERPDAAERASVEAKMRALEHPPAATAAPTPPAAVTPAPSSAVTPTPPSAVTSSVVVVADPVAPPATHAATTSAPAHAVWRRWWFWAALGGAAAVGVGLGVGLGARSGNGSGSFMPTLPGFGPGAASATVTR